MDFTKNFLRLESGGNQVGGRMSRQGGKSRKEGCLSVYGKA